MNPSDRPVCFVDSTAELGFGTNVWHFARVLANARIGNNCSIGSGAEVGAGSIVGDFSRISANVFLPAKSVIGTHVFIGPGVVFTDDRYPVAGNKSYDAEPPVVEDHASIGAGAVILPGVHIGRGARVGAGAVVSRSVPPDTLVRGEPARSRAPSASYLSLFQPPLGDETTLDPLGESASVHT